MLAARAGVVVRKTRWRVGYKQKGGGPVLIIYAPGDWQGCGRRRMFVESPALKNESVLLNDKGGAHTWGVGGEEVLFVWGGGNGI